MVKNILICTDSMGIGGVETAIYNQISAMIKRGYNVIVTSREGCYTRKIEELGAKFVEFDFSLENNFNLNKINKMISIIEKYNIDEIHIEKFMCILTMYPVCIIKEIPYVAYIHDGLNATYDWYIYNYDIYEILFKEFFKNANKIIAIKENIIDYTSKRFEIDKEKYKLINNGIDFLENLQISICDKKTKFLCITRLEGEKIQSVKNAIDFFIKYCDNTEEKCILSILGDGRNNEEIKEYALKKNIKNYTINFLGQSVDVLNVIKEYDIILGMGRCILEAISMKKLAIVSGYNKICDLVSKNNLVNMVKSNFNGEGEKSCELEKLIKKIKKLNYNEIKEIVEYNYNYAYDNLNIDKNIYTLDPKEELKIKKKDLINEMYLLQERYIQKKEQALSFENNVYELRKICDEQYSKINELYRALEQK